MFKKIRMAFLGLILLGGTVQVKADMITDMQNNIAVKGCAFVCTLTAIFDLKDIIDLPSEEFENNFDRAEESVRNLSVFGVNALIGYYFFIKPVLIAKFQ